jgi:hypothetical protein
MHEWIATCRCDWEEYYCTETFTYKLDTYNLDDAADYIINIIGSSYTLIKLERII